MIAVSLSEFVDFIQKSGKPKLTAVRHIKERRAGGYQVASDFYKPIRDGIVSMHKSESSKVQLDKVVSGLTDKKKQKAYPPLVKGYKRFLGHKDVSYFRPPKAVWSYGDLSVNINPELGLVIDGQPHAIKLYFKGQKLSKLQTDAINHLMASELAPVQDRAKLGVLDVRSGRFIPAEGPQPGIEALLEGEALALAEMYRAV
jgi:hypothetical protein